MHYLLVNFDNNGDTVCVSFTASHGAHYHVPLSQKLITISISFINLRNGELQLQDGLGECGETEFKLGFYSIADAKWLKVTNLNMIYESKQRSMRTRVCFQSKV